MSCMCKRNTSVCIISESSELLPGISYLHVLHILPLHVSKEVTTYMYTYIHVMYLLNFISALEAE